jgi:hypothetical protein
VSDRYEIKPVALRPNAARMATHDEVLAALKAAAKQLGLVPKLPAGKHGDHWRASIDGLTVAGVGKTFHVVGPADRNTLMLFAQQIAAIAGNQAIVGDADDEVWLVDPPKPKTKKKRKRS